MPLTSKGNEILQNMEKQYGEEKGKSVFYASKNAGTITGVDSEENSMAPRVDDKGQSVLHAIDNNPFAHDEEYALKGYVGQKGESVLHEISGGERAHDEFPITSHDGMTPGGSSGAVISPAPGLGLSAYQNPAEIPEIRND